MAAPTTSTRAAELGRTFRAARIGAGLSIRALADRAEISHATISRWERGERYVSEATYQHLLLALTDYMNGQWAA